MYYKASDRFYLVECLFIGSLQFCYSLRLLNRSCIFHYTVSQSNNCNLFFLQASEVDEEAGEEGEGEGEEDDLEGEEEVNDNLENEHFVIL